MGLDMYLSKKTYVGANFKHNKVTGKIDLKKDDKPIKVKLERVSYIEEQIGYWRKANHIHKFFVDNVQEGEDDCEDYPVYLEHIKDLLDRCKKVVESFQNSEKTTVKVKNGWNQEGDTYCNVEVFTNTKVAQELLPCSSGFFFGGTEYDEYYLGQTIETIEMLEEILKENNNDEFLTEEYYYTASW